MDEPKDVKGVMDFINSSLIALALSTLITFLGAEVAKPDIFDRLLWPQRYYNDIS
jgi:hypothetical protein